MDARQELTNMLKGFATHHKSNELVFKNAQSKKTYKGSNYDIWLYTRITYWVRHYNYKYNTELTISDAKLIYAELHKNIITEPIKTTKLQMKG